MTSACASPNRACQPSPTTASPEMTTAPTIGLGAVCPHPFAAFASARRIHARSRAAGDSPVMRSEADANADRAVGPRGIRCLVERVVRVDFAAADHADLAHDLEQEKVHVRV